MKGTSGVFVITNTVNNKKFVGISQDIENEWFNVKRDIRSGMGIKSMKEDLELYGEDAFEFEVKYEGNEIRVLHRMESELAYEYNVWNKGYNTKPLLNYRLLPEVELAAQKLRFFKMMSQANDGKYMFMDLLEILDISKNNLEIVLREITDEEMRFFKRRVFLRNATSEVSNYYVELKTYVK